MTARSTDFLAGGGEAGARMRAFNWTQTPLGPPASWPQSLKTIVRVMLDSRYAMWMLWGPDFTFFCNDAYLPTVGIRRDWVIGARSDKVWEEIWPDVGPRITHVLQHGEATWDEGLLLFLERSGFPEETYHTFSYSPIYDDHSAIAGMLCVVTEVSDRVISERRLGLLRDLAAGTAGAESAPATASRACDVLARYPLDVPLAAIYLSDAGTHTARLVASTREDVMTTLPAELPLEGEALARLGNLPASGVHIAAGPWPDPVKRIAVLPMIGGEAVVGHLVAAPSPRREFDQDYRNFLDLIAGHIGSALVEAESREAARMRAEALAELDRAKTTFFSNVSHEFRTPLTLMLAPVEEMLAEPALADRQRDQLDLVRRNAQRLQRLVNSLLDFSRIEAGRMTATFEAVELGAFTRDLASSFRSAIERAGLRYDVDCDTRTPAHVDKGMWEKIVLNLLSNAFKFTLQGSISVRLTSSGETAVLEVEDTGVGVPEAELTRLFERFYRVEGAQGRTHEGTGIGLSLVHELVKMHGGTIEVQSVFGRGTTFRVRLPLMAAHLSHAVGAHAETVPRSSAQSFVQEALRWLPDTDEGAASTSDVGNDPRPVRDQRFASTFGARIVLADDNADMRSYLRDLLKPFYQVEVVGDGEMALAAARAERPDLILSDIMMPRLDGLGVINAIRADAKLRRVPIVLLSARAGEEARIEGLDAGADDYMVKPFSSRELLARVGALLELGQMRRAAEDRLRLGLEAARMVVWDWNVATGDVQFSDNAREVFGGDWRDMETGLSVVHPDDAEMHRESIAEAILNRGVLAGEIRILRPDTGELRWIEVRGRVRCDAAGAPAHLSGVSVDITERKQAQALLAEQDHALQRRTAQFESLLRDAPMGVYVIDEDLRISEANPTARAVFGNLPDLIGRNFAEMIRLQWPPAYAEEIVARFRHTLDTGEPYGTPEAIEQRIDTGATESYEWQINRIPLPDGRHGVVCYFRDISAHIEARRTLLRQREALRAMDRQKDEFLAMLAHELRNPLAPIRNASELLSRIKSDEPRVQTAASIVKRQVTQLSRLVDDLLDMSRITQGRIELKSEPVLIADVVQHAVETVEPLLHARQHHLTTSACDQPLWVNGDSARLVQCVANVLTNAAKYTDDGGRIHVGCNSGQGQAVIRVTDNGAGISEDLLPRVFDLFVQSNRTLDRSQGGLGIGLSIVKRLAEMHGGRVVAHSDGIGKGATFEIRLPLISDTANRSVEHEPVPSPRRRVLVVDDNEDAANSLAMVLEINGHEVRSVYGARQALDLLQTWKPDTVLLDIGLPGMNGYEVALQIRKMPELQGAAIVAVTGYGQTEDRRRAVAAGFNDHLTKPVDFAQLERVLNRG